MYLNQLEPAVALMGSCLPSMFNLFQKIFESNCAGWYKYIMGLCSRFNRNQSNHTHTEFAASASRNGELTSSGFVRLDDLSMETTRSAKHCVANDSNQLSIYHSV